MSLLKVVLIGVGAIYLLVGALLYLLQDRFIFLPEALPADHTFEFDRPFDELWFERPDGGRINALHFHANKPKGIIMYHHGNAGNLSRWGEVSYFFLDLGYDVLIYDYRGYGKSVGRRSEQLMFSDAGAIYESLLEEWESSEIIIYGRSLGSGMASQLASEVPHGKLVLETPFHSMRDMAKRYFPLFPISALLKYQFNNSQHLTLVNTPIYLFHGDEDEVVPYESGQKLFEAVAKRHVTFHTIEGGHHNDLISFTPFREKLKEVLR